MGLAVPRVAELERPYARIGVKEQHLREAVAIAGSTGLHLVTARVLAARGFRAGTEELANFITPSLQQGVLSPDGLKNLDVACVRIAEAVQAGKVIALTNDFDVDGLSGGAQLYSFLTACGAKVLSLVPDRFSDGYGLNTRIIDEAAAAGATLLITVDFGTKNSKELIYARDKGLTSIVIDHHHVGDEVCAADIFVNPHQTGCGFAGGTLSAAGLCWYVIIGLRARIPQAAELKARDYLDLACLGTVCDMVPLVGVNRVIAKRGIELLSHTTRPGLIALKEVLGIDREVRSHDIGFGIGPRINAAGRLVHGSVVIELLTTSCPVTASRLAKQLHDLNDQRQKVERRVKEEADKLVLAFGQLPWGIVVAGETFHTGVIGIVAQRFTEEYHRPTAVLGGERDSSSGKIVYKGSVRGISGMSVVAALEALEHLLVRYGGHAGAGGFSLAEENLAEFSEAFGLECLRQVGDPSRFVPKVVGDTEVTCAEVTLPLVEELAKLGPFGVGNKAPVLVGRDLEVAAVKELKGGHLKITARDNTGSISGVLWRTPSHPALRRGAKVSLAFKPDKNTFQGNTNVQASIVAAQEG